MIHSNRDYGVQDFVKLVKKYGLKCKINYLKETNKRGTDGHARSTISKYVKVAAICVDGSWAIPIKKLNQLVSVFPGAIVDIDSTKGILRIRDITYSYKLFLVHI